MLATILIGIAGLILGWGKVPGRNRKLSPQCALPESWTEELNMPVHEVEHTKQQPKAGDMLEGYCSSHTHTNQVDCGSLGW